MNRTEKASRVNELSARAVAPFILVTEIRGTKSTDINALRRSLEKSGMSFKVIKNTLAKRALAEVGVTGLDPKLKGMTGFVFSSADGIASARAAGMRCWAVRTEYTRGLDLGEPDREFDSLSDIAIGDILEVAA